MECERCHSKSEGYNLFDYCAVCSTNLCPHCMAEGCCGNVPAESGMEVDDGETFEAAEHSVHTDPPSACPACGTLPEEVEHDPTCPLATAGG